MLQLRTGPADLDGGGVSFSQNFAHSPRLALALDLALARLRLSLPPLPSLPFPLSLSIALPFPYCYSPSLSSPSLLLPPRSPPPILLHFRQLLSRPAGLVLVFSLFFQPTAAGCFAAVFRAVFSYFAA